MSIVRSDIVTAPVHAAAERPEPRFHFRNYAVLLKPRVMSLVVFTALVGMLLAPVTIDPFVGLTAIACVALACASVGAMAMFVNLAAAALLAFTIAYYVFVYTVWLKRRTPQNIVIGGVSGALPPMIGWAATTGDVGWGALALFAIIFLWTPPHSWALALFRKGDYDRAGVPMMPIVAGERSTRAQMLAYTCTLVPATFLPIAIGTSGWPYGLAAPVLGVGMLR